MLDLNEVYGEPRSITLPYLRSFMQTFQVGIRNREANSSALRNMWVKAFSVEHADAIARKIIAPYDMIVKDVIRPGSEIYGEEDGYDADPLPILKSEVVERLRVGEIPSPTSPESPPCMRNAPKAPLSPFEKGKSIYRSLI